ncbi:hypothetical protein V6R85_02510 [Agrobacterium sp. CCNWLW32]|uniref:hypothetical protein n=1 Tax=Agrobacterium sp. CCNWLW32 TaxID=3122072 RepID=UPI00300FE599
MDNRLASAIVREAERIGANPADLATVMSYETGGTFDPWKQGPTTKWGQHIGLIQMGQPQREKYNYYKGMPIEDAVRVSADYLVDAGFKPGMGLLEMYSAINAGGIGEQYYGRSDAGAGGAPGTVRDKVQYQMGSHKQKAVALLNGEFTPTETTYYTSADTRGPEIQTTANDVVMAPQPKTYVEQNANPEPEPYSFLEGVGANYESFGITSHLTRWMGESGTDPYFTIGDERGTHLTKQYPSQYHDFLLSSGSEFNLRSREQWVREDLVRQARMGVSGTAANISQGLVAGAIDPVSVAVGVGTGGMGGAALGVGRVGRALYGAVSGAAVNAALDFASGEVTDNPYADPVTAGTFGAVFGAFGGALAANRGSSFEAHAAYDTAASVRRGIKPPDVAPEGGSIQLSGSGGAARNPEMRDSLIGLDRGLSIEMSDESVPKGFGGWFRKGDVTGQMTTAKNPFTRLIGAHFFEETAGFTDHSVVPDSVNSRFTAAHRKAEGNFNASYLPAKNAFIKEAGLSRLNLTGQAKLERDFNRMVADYIWDPAPSPDSNPHVVKAAGAFRKSMADFARDMEEAGLWKGGPDANYVPLVADHNVIAHVDQMVHHEVMEKFFKDAIKDHGGARISDDLAARMAKGYWANIRKAGYGIEDAMSKSLHLEDRDGFKKAFQEALEDQANLTNKELDEVFDILSGLMDTAKKTEGDSSKGVGYLKRRTLMNHSYKATIQTRDGKLIELRPRDLFEQDAELLFRRYSRSMSGRIAFAKTKIFNPETGELIVDGIRSTSDLDKLKQSLKESYRLMPGNLADKEGELKNALENIDFGWAKINGIPVYGSEKAHAQWARRVKSMQFIRLMSNMGLNQVQETWKIVSLTGFRAAMSQIPAIREMNRAVSTGKLGKDKLLNELSDMTGIGMDNLWNRYDLRLDDDRLGAQTGGRLTQVVDNVLDAGQRLTANVSFMRQIHDYQQRWAMKAITQQIADMARKTRNADGSFDYSKLKPRDRDRMASIGLGEDDAKKLFKDLIDHSEFDGNKIVGVNTMKWDPSNVSKYRVFLNRYTDRLVQQNDFGALSKWMSNPVASMFIQFRSFVFGAWAKSTLWTLNHGAFTDPKMMVLLLGELAAGTATFAVRQSGTAITEDGWEKYWEETMQPANLLKNGFARTATASVVPMFLDTILMSTPLGPQFGQARASGSATDAWLGSPVADQIDSAMQFSRGAMRSVWEGEDMTQQQIKAGIRAFAPLGNWVPFTAALGALIEDRPER